MNSSKFGLVVMLGALGVGGLALWPASAQPGGAGGGQPPPAGGRPDGQPSEWREKFRQEMREHPRIARSIVSLHETRDYLDKAPDDFGGHKAAAIKACDDAIKELTEALKFDPKAPDNPNRANGGGRRGGQGGGGGGGQPAGGGGGGGLD